MLCIVEQNCLSRLQLHFDPRCGWPGFVVEKGSVREKE